MNNLRFRAFVKGGMRYDVTGLEHGIHNEMVGVFVDGIYYRIGYDSDEAIVGMYSGLESLDGHNLYEGDVVYIAGYGDYVCQFPFIELYEASYEGDIGKLVGNIHDNPELKEICQ